jgi:hypothetical protein
MEDHRSTRGIAAHLALAAGGFVLCIGFPFVNAFVCDHILTGAWVHVWYMAIGIFLVPAVLLAAWYSYEEGYIRNKLLGLAAAIGFAACLVLTFYAEQERTLAERGQTATCLVTTVKLEYRDVFRGLFKVYPKAKAEYVHHLQCPQDGPDRIVTGSRIADEGTSVAVFWAPSERIAPQPARHLGDYRTLFWLAVGAACAGDASFILMR